MTLENTGNELHLPPLPTDPQGRPLITRILIANRGEIACRVIDSCKKLGITSIAVFTDPYRSSRDPQNTLVLILVFRDRSAKHVRLAEEAFYIGNISTAKTHPHQDIPLLVATALKVKADAIHPGYGYLSENAEFACAVQEAGLIWIGPSPESISVLGDKRSAKEYLNKYARGVPLIPGFGGKSQDPGVLKGEAEKIGYPVLVKASAGGGGKGMRIVRRSEDFVEELQVRTPPLQPGTLV